MNEDMSESRINTPLGSFSFKGKRMAEFIAILSLCLLFLLGYIVWEHKTDTKGQGTELAKVFREMVIAQRELNCLISVKQEERENKAELCRRLAQ